MFTVNSIIIIIFIINIYTIIPTNTRNNNLHVTSKNALKSTPLNTCLEKLDPYHLSALTTYVQFHSTTAEKKKTMKFITKGYVYIHTKTETPTDATKFTYTAYMYRYSNTQPDDNVIKTFKIFLLSSRTSDSYTLPEGQQKEIIKCIDNLNWGDCTSSEQVDIAKLKLDPKTPVDECEAQTAFETDLADFSAYISKPTIITQINSNNAKYLQKEKIKNVRLSSKSVNNDYFTTIFNDAGTKYCHLNSQGNKHTLIIGTIPPTAFVVTTEESAPIMISIKDAALKVFEESDNKFAPICPGTPDVCNKYLDFTMETNTGYTDTRIYLQNYMFGLNKDVGKLALSKKLAQSIDAENQWCFTDIDLTDKILLSNINIFILILVTLLFI